MPKGINALGHLCLPHLCLSDPRIPGSQDPPRFTPYNFVIPGGGDQTPFLQRVLGVSYGRFGGTLFGPPWGGACGGRSGVHAPK